MPISPSASASGRRERNTIAAAPRTKTNRTSSSGNSERRGARVRRKLPASVQDCASRGRPLLEEHRQRAHAGPKPIAVQPDALAQSEKLHAAPAARPGPPARPPAGRAPPDHGDHDGDQHRGRGDARCQVTRAPRTERCGSTCCSQQIVGEEASFGCEARDFTRRSRRPGRRSAARASGNRPARRRVRRGGSRAKAFR